MAVVQTDKQLALVGKMIAAATALDDLAADLEQLAAEFPQAGQMVDGIFVDTAYQHVDANDMATLIARFGTVDSTTGLVAWLNASNRRDILRKVRIS